MTSSPERNGVQGELSPFPYSPWLPLQLEEMEPSPYEEIMSITMPDNDPFKFQTSLLPPTPPVRKQWCHVCGSQCDATIPAAECRENSCGRVICRLCFIRYRWNWTHIQENAEWKCTHCRGTCPAVAYCRINGKKS